MNERPKIRIEEDENDKKISNLGIIFFIFIWAFSIFAYFSLPETIPTHFNFAGEVDDYGSKWMILFLPTIGTIMYFSLRMLNKYPHNFNFPVKITTENALKQYTLATKMMRLLNVELLFVFSIIQLFTYFSARGNVSGAIFWFLPIVLALIFGTLIYFFIKMYKLK